MGHFSTQASVNPKTETVEELLARRKNLHMGMLKLAREDLHYTLQAKLEEFQVPYHPTNHQLVELEAGQSSSIIMTAASQQKHATATAA